MNKKIISIMPSCLFERRLLSARRIVQEFIPGQFCGIKVTDWQSNKLIFAGLIFILSWSCASEASQPHYYSFNKVLLVEGEITIEASTKHNGELLDVFRIDTPDGEISLNSRTLAQILNPKLNSIEMALMPYESAQGIQYFNEVSMTFRGKRICSTDIESPDDSWAPESKIVIIFSGVEHKVRFDNGQCNENN
jgi:hypothetical protein